jgi:hypothetical protein
MSTIGKVNRKSLTIINTPSLTLEFYTDQWLLSDQRSLPSTHLKRDNSPHTTIVENGDHDDQPVVADMRGAFWALRRNLGRHESKLDTEIEIALLEAAVRGTPPFSIAGNKSRRGG